MAEKQDKKFKDMEPKKDAKGGGPHGGPPKHESGKNPPSGLSSGKNPPTGSYSGGGPPRGGSI